MLYLFNNLNKYQNIKEYRKLQEENKISSDEVYSFYFEEDYSRFLNTTLSKSFFTNKVKFVVLKIVDTDVSNTNFDKLISLLKDFDKSENYIILEVDSSVYRKLESKIERRFNLKLYEYRELQKVIDALLKEYKFKVNFNFKKKLFQLKDPFLIESEIKKISLLEKENNPQESLIYQAKGFNLNSFYKNFLLQSNQSLVSLKEIADSDNFYLVLEYFIQYVVDLIIYQLTLNNVNDTNKKEFLIKNYDEEKSLIVNQIKINELNRILDELIIIKREYLFARSNNKNDLIFKKLMLLFLSK